MIRKSPPRTPIRGGYRFSEKIMRKQQAKAKYRINPKPFRFRNSQKARSEKAVDCYG